MLIDITGERYNRLEVKGLAYVIGSQSFWECECDCGNVVILRKNNFAYSWSHQKSCGCLHREKSSQRMRELHKRRRSANISQKGGSEV